MPSFLKLFCFICLTFLSTIAGIAQSFTSSNLPLVVINTNGQTILDDPKIYADMGIIWNGAGKRNALTDPKNNYNGKIGIEKRGSSSQNFPKKSYGFETKSSALVDIDVSLLGLPEENDWVLYGPYTDKTMVRDVLSYTLDASFGHWAPRCRYVELFLNSSYQGVYVLIEKIKRNKNRVNIAKLTTTDNSGADLTGGYIIKIDKSTGGGGEGWLSAYSNAVGYTKYLYDYPKPSEITTQQKSYIQSYFRSMENSLYQEKFSGSGNYHEYLNDSSFIDFMIINELAKNVDGYRISSYLCKGKNDRVNCGPIWDFNLTYGNANYYDGWNPTGFQYQAYLGNDGMQNPFWWGKLMKDPEYVKKLKKRWATLRKNELAASRINFVIDSLTTLISEARGRNYQKWTGVIGTYVWPNFFVGSTYDSELIWMKNWITQRLAWLDQQWPYDFTGNEPVLASGQLSVFPNPFNDYLEIRTTDPAKGEICVELYSVAGIQVHKTKFSFDDGQIRLASPEIEKLPAGVYLLKVVGNNQILLSKKVVKTGQ